MRAALESYSHYPLHYLHNCVCTQYEHDTCLSKSDLSLKGVLVAMTPLVLMLDWRRQVDIHRSVGDARREFCGECELSEPAGR
jgi:hypothetical protein